jgi:hypothetical protein
MQQAGSTAGEPPNHPDFPSRHLGTVLALWHLCHCGLIGSELGSTFTPEELMHALLETDRQSPLLVAVQVSLVRIISKSAQSANTVTWRTTLARVLSYGGGNRVRNRLRTL